MKVFWVLVLLFSALSAFGEEVRVHRMKRRPGMEMSFRLYGQLPEKMVLDCQSFVQGLSIGDEEDGKFFMLWPDECESLYQRINRSHRNSRPHCLEITDFIRADYAC